MGSASGPARIALSLGALALTLGALELGVRVVAPQPMGVHIPDDLRRGPFVVPGQHALHTSEFEVQVHVNQDGFVDTEWSPRRADVPRVLVVGDSFVQAAQVPLEDGLGRLLARGLTQAQGREVEVLSMGVPGAGTATALDLIRGPGIALEPDVVVLGFLVSNDIMNNHPLLEGKADKPFYRLVDGQLVRTDRASALSSGVEHLPLWAVSHAVRWMARRWWVDAEVKRQLSIGEGLPISLRVHDPEQGPVWEEAWAVTDAMLAELSALCQSRGIRFGVMLIPDEVQVSPLARKRLQSQWPQSAGWRMDIATERVAVMAAQYAEVLDLQPGLEREEGRLYFPEDGHWTPAGHAAAASTAVPWLSAMLE